MPPGVLPPAINTAIRDGQTVLTANQRAARVLRQAFDVEQVAQGLTNWTPPEIFALETWLSILWRQLLLQGKDDRVLLNRTQQQAIWRSILSADATLPRLRPVDSLAQLAARAWHLVNLHQGSLHHPDFTLSADTRAFQRWALSFERTCVRERLLTPAQLPGALVQAHIAGDLSVPDAGLLLVDFDHHPAAHAGFLNELRRAGYAVNESRAAEVPEPNPRLLTAPDDQSELNAAVTWARDLLARDPRARIAVVVPNLAERRAAVQQVFAACLAPELQPVTRSAAPLFEFSLGTPLAETAPVATALHLLQWTFHALPLDHVSSLLMSPFFGSPELETGLPAAARFDTFELRETSLLRPELTLDSVVYLIRNSRLSGSLNDLLGRLRALQRAAALPIGKTYSGFADHFRKVLNAAGWAQLTSASSQEFQIYQRWDGAVDELASLDLLGLNVTASTALEALIGIARQTIFAPESRDASVQILGPLEVGGLSFDALWFLSGDDAHWPATPAMHALLPRTMQRTLNMPGASSQTDAEHSRALTQRILSAANNVVVSLAEHADEGERRVCPLFRDLRPLDLESVPPSPVSLFEQVPEDSQLPSLPDLVISGGAQILQLQAACGFRAFAERRLFASEPDARAPGLDALDRGILVHEIMQLFWSQLKSQTALRGLSNGDREALLDACIEAALEPALRSAETQWDHAYLDVQRRRLQQLLLPWLGKELERPAFAVSDSELSLKDVSIGPLRLNLRVDRIDQTAGGALILDYKTGPATPSQWLTDRPDAPQLPLYASVANIPDLAGIAFALLRAGDELALKGFAESAAVLAKPSENRLMLADQLVEWRSVLTNLAQAFADGDTAVAPKSYPKTCQYCGQRVLCRLNPTALLENADQDDDHSIERDVD